MTTNEAAKRLRYVLQDLGGVPVTEADLDAALAEERRHLIEQIRERVASEAHSPNCEYGSDIIAILDGLSTPEQPA